MVSSNPAIKIVCMYKYMCVCIYVHNYANTLLNIELWNAEKSDPAVDEIRSRVQVMCCLCCGKPELRRRMGSGMFGSGVDGTGLLACLLELHIIPKFK
jgi:hypothetical protein